MFLISGWGGQRHAPGSIPKPSKSLQPQLSRELTLVIALIKIKVARSNTMVTTIYINSQGLQNGSS